MSVKIKAAVGLARLWQGATRTVRGVALGPDGRLSKVGTVLAIAGALALAGVDPLAAVKAAGSIVAALPVAVP